MAAGASVLEGTTSVMCSNSQWPHSQCRAGKPRWVPTQARSWTLQGFHMGGMYHPETKTSPADHAQYKYLVQGTQKKRCRRPARGRRIIPEGASDLPCSPTDGGALLCRLTACRPLTGAVPPLVDPPCASFCVQSSKGNLGWTLFRALQAEHRHAHRQRHPEAGSPLLPLCPSLVPFCILIHVCLPACLLRSPLHQLT